MQTITQCFLITLSMLLIGCAIQSKPKLLPTNWNNPALWTTNRNPESRGQLSCDFDSQTNRVLRLEYELGGERGYVEIAHKLQAALLPEVPLALRFRALGTGRLELKLVDSDGSTSGIVIPITSQHAVWTNVVLHLSNTEYWWGGRDCDMSNIAMFQIAVATKGTGTLWLDVTGNVQPGIPSTLPRAGGSVDPDCDAPGFGFEQRRDAELAPRDSLVLEWLKLMQDISSPEQQLIPSQEDNEAHTFNNALCAMAFMLEGERERAERILDFYARATRRDNEDLTLQNFFYRGEARGFYQSIALRSEGDHRAYHIFAPANRWMGDMVWLMFAYLYHAQCYGPERYDNIRSLILNLLLSWYTDTPEGTGYIRHGWIRGDTQLHESFGHHEGNIDAYALMQLYGKREIAKKIRAWLEPQLCGRSLPLDLYSWRVLAFGSEARQWLSIPECDLRYRKTVEFNGKKVTGFYDHADGNVTNLWIDGIGHMACAYFAVGDFERGNFYANQMDRLIIERHIAGHVVHAIPYTTGTSGGYGWVDIRKGFSSAAAWYLFAKHRFNPMTLKKL